MPLMLMNFLKTYGLTNHLIKLKLRTTIIEKLDQYKGSYNGTRLIVTVVTNYVIEVIKIISNKYVGNLIYISRMSMSLSQSHWSEDNFQLLYYFL